MITEDYVGFETAKLLKEKGFEGYSIFTIYDENAANAYIKELQEKHLPYSSDDPKFKEFYYTQPTLQMAMKWLREVHGIIIIIDTNDMWLGEGNRFYWCRIYYKMGNRIEIKWYNDPSKPKDILRYQTYEEACEAGIKYCLKNLI